MDARDYKFVNRKSIICKETLLHRAADEGTVAVAEYYFSKIDVNAKDDWKSNGPPYGCT